MDQQPNSAGDDQQQPEVPAGAVGALDAADGVGGDLVEADAGSDQADAEFSLVEVIPGIAVVFGNAPVGLEIAELGLIPREDRNSLAHAFGTFTAGAAAVGEMKNALAPAKGLYRVDDATRALLESGARLATKDGAKLGALLKNGKIVGQARFVPVSGAAAPNPMMVGIAAAMVAIQMQLSEISELAQTNIALTTEVLESIRHEQWSELNGLVVSMDRTVRQASSVGEVSRSLWENVSGKEDVIEKQLDLYRRNVRRTIAELEKLDGEGRREYLETHAEAIVFDANALLHALKLHVGYQALRVARARSEGQDGTASLELAEAIAKDAGEVFASGRSAASHLIGTLVRELRIIAELPGRRTMPLTRSRRDAEGTRLTCAQLLAALEPIADRLRPVSDDATPPPIVCAPDEADLGPYLRILRWHLEEGEELQALAFAYQPALASSPGFLGPVLGKRADAAWSGLAEGRRAAVLDKVTSSTLVAVTSTRVLTATPRELLRHGTLDEEIPHAEVQFVRTPSMLPDAPRPTVELFRPGRSLQWIFPANAVSESIDAFAKALAADPDSARAVIDAG